MDSFMDRSKMTRPSEKGTKSKDNAAAYSIVARSRQQDRGDKLSDGSSRSFASTEKAYLRELQKTIGNQAVGFLVSSQRRDPFVIQREPILDAMSSGKTGELPPLTPDELRQLNVEASSELRRLAGNAIWSAKGQFEWGCEDVKEDLAKRAKQQAEMIAVVVDIMAGFAAPALAGALVAESALRKTLAETTKKAKIGDLSAMVDSINALEKLKERGASLNPQFWDRISGDNLKATFTGAAKVPVQGIKTLGPSVLTGDKKKIVAQLGQLAHQGAQDLDRSLPTLSEWELMALIVGLDAGKTNRATYADAIRRYLSEVIPIGEGWTAQTGGGKTELVKMNAYGGFRLAVVESGVAGAIFGTPYHDFKSWISPGMQAGALSRAGMTMSQVPALDPAIISNHIPPPSREDSQIMAP